LVDDLVLATNYTGTILDLRGLKESGRIFIRTNSVTDLLLDDLEKAGSIEYDYGIEIKTVSAPKLTSAGEISFRASESAQNITFPVLTEASSLALLKGLEA